jgi:hypothetical protein
MVVGDLAVEEVESAGTEPEVDGGKGDMDGGN